MRKPIVLLFTLLCLLAVQGFAALPVTTLQSPAPGGAATSQQFQIAATDSSGAQDVATSWLIFSVDGTSYVNGCGIRFVVAENGIQILNDAGNLWSASSTLGGSGVLSNNQCSVSASTAYKTAIGNTYVFSAIVTFKPGFYGPKTMLGLSSNVAGQYNPTPYNLGTWGTSTANYPSTFLVSPAGGGSGSSGTFTFGSTSTAGASDIATSWLIFSPNGGYANACGIWFKPPSNTVYLLNDAGTDWGTGVTIGSAGTKSNSQCSVNTAQTSRIVVGANTQNYTFTVTFMPAFSGSKTMLGLSSNLAGQFNPAYTLGNWTIPMQDQIIGYVKESPATLNPGELNMSRITLSQAGEDLNTMALRVYHGGDPITFRIRYAKPNSQVWVTRIATVPANAPSAGTPYVHTICGPDNGHQYQGIQQAILDPVNGDNYGACYLGMTDATGYLEWTGQIWYSTAPQTYGEYLSGMISAQFYIGPQIFNPNFPGITDGPMNEDNYMGALVYWVIGSDGYQGPAPY
jgi:hypothetical protein